MARFRQLAPSYSQRTTFALGLLTALMLGAAFFSTRPALSQVPADSPKPAPINPPAPEQPPSGVELPPPLPEVPQSRPPEPPPAVVATSATQEFAPQQPPLTPAPKAPDSPTSTPKPAGGFVEGPIITVPVPTAPAAAPPQPTPLSAPVLPSQIKPPVPPPPAPRGEQTLAPPLALPSQPVTGSVTPPAQPEAPVTVPNLAPLASAPAVSLEGSGSITIRVSDENIRKALELLSVQGSVNIVPSVGVAGNVTLNLRNVTFDQALDVLVKVGNLGVRREGSIVYVYTAQELAELEAKGKIPVVRVYCLNYIRAGDLAQMIRPFLSQDGTLSVTPSNQSGIGGSTAAGTTNSGGGSLSGISSGSYAGGGSGGGGGGASLGGGGTGMSGGGVSSGGTSAAGSTISTGSETGGNSLAGGDSVIVRDYAENIAHIDEIIAKLDVQPMQVLIEAVILSVQLDDSQQLGMNFSLVDKLQNVAAVGGNGALINAAAGFSPARVLTTTAAVAPSLLPRPGQLVSGYLSPDQGLKFGFISRDVSGFIRAIETLNKVNILASPRVLVLNKQRAEIQLGQRLGYRNTVTNLTSSLQTVQFLSVGTLLSLRPFVSHDGMVRMEIHPEKSTGSLDSNGVPQTNTSELTTNILVPDGATIVIGGLIDSADQNGQQGILGLSRLPVVGPLFRERITKATKTELIVLLTPRILNRASLPEPQPGMPPMGPSGVPNSGPMPGPAIFANQMEGMPPPPIDGVGSRNPKDGAGPADELAPITTARLHDYRWIGATTTKPAEEKPPLDEPLRPASFITGPTPGSEPVVAASLNTPSAAGSEKAPPTQDEREIPIKVSAPPLGTADQVREALSKKSTSNSAHTIYRPGDLTRSLISKLKSRSTDSKPKTPGRQRQSELGPAPPEPSLASKPVQKLPATKPTASPPAERLTSYAPPAPRIPSDPPFPLKNLSNPSGATGVTYRWHTVQPGEDFGTLSEHHYGSASLRSALWQVNRHLVPAPEQLSPGTMILIPPAGVLDSLIQDGALKSVEAQDGQGRGDSESAAPKRRYRLFGKP